MQQLEVKRYTETEKNSGRKGIRRWEIMGEAEKQPKERSQMWQWVVIAKT